MPHTLARVLLSTSLSIAAPTQATWSLLYPTASPPARVAHAMACFEATGEVVMSSGSVRSGSGWTRADDCWVLRGSAWSQVSGPRPPQRNHAEMVYDSIRQRLVLFGGYSQGNLDDTWEWDGSSWSQRTTATAPPGRSLFSMAFDRERGVTVLFGGYGSTPFLGDLWEWDGVSWVERTPTTGPEARRSAAMAFDPIRRDIVMYGGLRTQNGNDIPSLETWSWDGSSWLRQTPLTPPPYLTQARAVADLRRHRVVLHGGEFGYFTWEWDGQQWRVPSQSSPAPRVDHGMAYDPVGRRIVLFGGQLLGAAVADTWVFQTPHPADAVPYGNGCAGTSGVPELGNRGDSWPWIGDTYQQRVANLAPTSGGAFFVTGFTAPSPISLTPFGMPGCSQLVTPAIVEPRAAVGGESVWSLAIPNSVAFANVQLFQQAIALDGGANIAGLTVSNGVELTIGIR